MAESDEHLAEAKVPVPLSDEVCAGCHQKIYESYQQTPMARASGPALDGILTGRFEHSISGVTYKVFEESGKVFLSYHRDGVRELDGERELKYYIGSGKRGRTYLYQQEGLWFEAPINYYSSTHAWDMAPNFGGSNSMPSVLRVDANCLHCHSTGVRPSGFAAPNRFNGEPFAHGGLGCSVCHGDAVEHVATQGHSRVINPDKLAATKRDSICLQCHLEGSAAVYRAGTALSAFRPGDDVFDDVAYFVKVGSDGGRFRAASQYEGLLRSRCKVASGDKMTCTTCHDPHYSPDPKERITYYRAKCLSCHSGEAIAVRHHAEQQDCSACHMPTRSNTDISHEQATDHFIRVLKANQNEQVPPSSRETILQSVGPERVGDRETGLAYSQFAQYGDRAAAGKALVLLRRAVAGGENDSELHAKLGLMEQMQGNMQNAIDQYRLALVKDSNDPVALGNLAVLLAANGHVAEAVSLLDRVLDNDPGQTTMGMNLAFIECRGGKSAHAISILNELRRFNPDDPMSEGLPGIGELRWPTLRSASERRSSLNVGLDCRKRTRWEARLTACGAAGCVLGLLLTPNCAAQKIPSSSASERNRQTKTSVVYQSDGTRKMAALLEQIFKQNDWKADPSKQAERVVYYQSLLKHGLPFLQQVTVQMEMAKEMLRAGDSETSIKTLEDLRSKASSSSQSLPAGAERELGSWLALAYLRLGEQDNCAHMRGQKECSFPLHQSAVHSKKRGAQGAIRELTALLTKDTNDAESRWLINIAYMQLGLYPDEVPKNWLIPASLFNSEQEIGDFPDFAPMAGLDVTGHAGGVIMEDFDGDGLLDVMISSSGPRDQLRLFHNNGDGTFADVTEQAGLMGEVGGLNLIVTDYNNDGHPDVLVLRGGWWNKFGEYPMSLLRNNGDGTFDDVTEAAGLMSLHPTQTAAWADFDNDGYLDLFVGHESSKDDPHPSQLFHNNGDGTFTEIGKKSGLSELGFVKGVAWGDYNLDGRPDLYVSVMGGKNHLFRNDGPSSAKGEPVTSWRFTDVAASAGVDTQRNSFATWFFDYDNDGWPDIFVAGYSTESVADVGAFEMGKAVKAEKPRLYHNNHDGTFSDVTQAVHLDRAILVMGANFGDLDNDGFLDIYLGTGESSYQALLPNRMFRNDKGQRFLDVTTSGGFGNLQKGHGVAFGDLENTGNEDVFEEMGGALPGDTYHSMLYHNPGHGNHWLTLRLEGVKTNRAAFGARICVTVESQGAERQIYRTVGYGSSFGGNPLEQHIGLGDATIAKLIKIEWPSSGLTQRFAEVKTDQTFRLREGDDHLIPVPRKAHP